MIDLSHLTPKSTLGLLPLHNFQVQMADLGHVLESRFEQQPTLPGVIIMQGTTMVSMISRQKFVEQMSRGYGRDIHSGRPIHLMLDGNAPSPLVLPDTCRIDEAAGLALNREEAIVYDPVVVSFRDGSFRLIDLRDLLLAQSQVLFLVNQTVRRQKLALQECLTQLQQEQTKVEESNQALAVQQEAVQERNHLLEQKQQELLQQSQQISHLNQRFVQIGRILSVEGKKAFQATAEAVAAIFSNTDNMIGMGKSLSSELEAVQKASNSVKDISKRAKFLSFQAAILTNKLGSQFEGVSRITSDIGTLSSQTFETGQWMDETASSLKDRIGDLTRLARDGASEAQALIDKVNRAEVALAELETLLAVPEEMHLNSLFEIDRDQELTTIYTLMQQVERSGAALLELETISQQDHRRSRLLN